MLAFNFFSIFHSGGHLIYRSKTILAILVGSHLVNIPEEVCTTLAQWFTRRQHIKQIIHVFLFFSSGGHFVHRSETVLAILVEGHLSNIRRKFE